MSISLDFESEAEGDAIIGVDEAGRGPLAGGVFAAALTIPLSIAKNLLENEWREINDSKKISEKLREKLSTRIKETPQCIWAVASASSEEIDELNILRATHLAMSRAAKKVADQIKAKNPFVLVDGLPVPTLPFPSRNIIKGDAKSLFIAAASILAKTARDADCLRMEKEYPEYGFSKHKGYPTKEHFAALEKFGPCPEHRRSFGPVKERILSSQDLPLFK